MWKSSIRAALFVLALMWGGQSFATGVIPLVGTQLFDKDSSPPAFLNGGLVDIYLAGTTTPAPIFSDFALAVPLANPFTLNAAGRFNAVYVADGSYRIRVRNSASVLQFDDDNVPATTAAVTNTPVVVVASQLWNTGDVKVRYDDQNADGFVRANGRTIGSATSGAAERANADCEALFKFLWGFANISVVTGKGATAAADWSANKQLTLPDMAGRLIGARDDLGAGAKSRITATTVTGPTLAGAVGGTETKAILQANLPAVNFTNSGITLADAQHRHFISSTDTTIGGLSAANELVFQANQGTDFSYTLSGGAIDATIGRTSAASSGISVSAQGVAASGGSGTALPTISPVMLFTVYLKL